MSDDDKTPGKRKKPIERFPLTLHPRGYWCKRVLGKLHYFGKDQDQALAEWLRVKDDLKAGRPRSSDSGDSERMTLATLCNRFLDSKKGEVEDGELTQQSWDDYRRECKRVLEILGRNTVVDQMSYDDFTKLRRGLAKGVSKKTLEGRVARCRALFRFGELRKYVAPLSHKMVDTFKKPSGKALSKERGDTVKMFQPEEIRLLLEHAVPNMKAIILLGINCGYGPQDIAEMTLGNLDLAGGWLTQLRSKTGKPRRAPLWPETVKALRVVLEGRLETMKAGDRVFLSKTGQPLNGVTVSRKKAQDGKDVAVAKVNPISSDFLEFRRTQKITGRDKSIYVLRHTFKTIALNATLNEYAVDRIMGHLKKSVPAIYMQMITDERLREATNAVHAWLFPPKPKRKPKGK